MANEKPPSHGSFSRPFGAALIVTRMTDAMARADGWQLEQLAEAPSWLQNLYSRHADAACAEMTALREEEGNLKPSQ